MLLSSWIQGLLRPRTRRTSKTTSRRHREDFVQLYVTRLEDRRVLDASFAAVGGALTLDTFTETTAGAQQLTVTDADATHYQFQLADGVWNGTDDGTDIVGSGTDTLTVLKTAITNVSVLDDDGAGIDFGVEFGTADFTSLTGMFQVGGPGTEAVGDVTQTADTTLLVSNLGLSAGAVTLGQGGTTTAFDVDTLSLGVTSATVQDSDGIALGASSVTGALTVIAGGDITQNAGISVGGAGAFIAGVTNDVTLNDATNAFSTVSVGGVNVSLADADDIDLGGSTVTGNLDVTAGGAITQSAGISVSGTATLSAGSIITPAAITLNDVTNDFNIVAVVYGSDVALTDANGIVLGTSTVGGTFDVTALDGSITQSGALSVAGTTTLSASTTDVATRPNDIMLTTATNDFATVAVTAGRNVALTDGGGLILANITTSGGLMLNVGAASTQEASTTINGAGGLTKLGAGTLTLSEANTYTGTTTINAGSLIVANAQALGNATSTILLGDTTGTANAALLLNDNYLVTRDITVRSGSTGTATIGNMETSTGTFSGDITLDKNVILTADVSGMVIPGVVNFSGAISGSGGVNKQGDQRIAFNGSTANAYTGTTTVEAGLLSLSKTSLTSIAGNLVIQNGGSVQIELDEQIANTSAVTVQTGGSLLVYSSSLGTPVLTETVGSLAGGGSVDFGSKAGVFTVGDATDTEFSGVISGTNTGAVFAKQGSGTLTLSGTNTFNGQFTVNVGTLAVGNASALGSTTTGTVVNAGGTLQINDTFTVAGEALTLAGGSLNSAGTAVWGNAATPQIMLAAASTIGGTGAFTIGSNIDGAFDLTIAGSASHTFGGQIGSATPIGDSGADTALTITATGATVFQNVVRTTGGITQADTAAQVTLEQNVTIGGTAASTFDANVVLDGLTFVSGGAVTFGNAGTDTLAISTAGVTLDTSSNNAALTINSATTLNQTLTVNAGSNAASSIAGVLSGAAGLTKQGGGTLTLSVANTYTGTTTVTGGTLVVNGSIDGTSGTVEVNNGATLAGTGSIGTTINVNAGGTLAGTLSTVAAVNVTDGAVRPGSSPGVLQTGSVTFDADSELFIELVGANPGPGADNPAPGSGHDQLDVTGSVNLGGATLTLDLTGLTSFQPGTQFVIVNNDDTDAVVGTFSNFAEGAQVDLNNNTADGFEGVFTYRGGDGNDVAIVAKGGTVTFTGTAGADNYFILRDGTSLQVIQGGTLVGETVVGGTILDSRPILAGHTITINAGDGNDTLTILLSRDANGAAAGTDDFLNLFTGTINFNGQGNDDTLVLARTTGGADTIGLLVHTFTNTTDGAIVVDDDATTATPDGNAFTINYTGVDTPLQQNIGSTQVVLNYTTGADAVTVSAAGAQTQVAADTAQTLLFNNPTTLLQVNTGTANDSVTVNGLGTGFDASVVVNGGADVDTIAWNTSLTLTTAGRFVTLHGETIQLNGSLTTNAGDITLAGDDAATPANAAVELQTDVALSTGANGGDIAVTGTINSQATEANTLTVTAGTGNFSVSGAVGAATDGALGAITVNSAANVTFAAAVTTTTNVGTETGNVTQTAGTGLTTFNGGGIGGLLSVVTNAITLATATVTTVGTVNLNAQNAVSLTTGAGLNAGASTVTIAANQDNAGAEGFSMADGTTIQTTNDTVTAVSITVGGTGSAALATVTAGTTNGRITVNAGGAITDANDPVTTTLNLTAGESLLTAATGIGTSGNPLETQLARLEALGGTGGVYITETNLLQIGGVDAGTTGVSATGGNIVVTTTNGALMVADVSHTGGGNVTLVAGGDAADDDLTVQAIAIQTTGGNGNVLLVAYGDVVFTNNGANTASTVSAVGAGTVGVHAGATFAGTLNTSGGVGTGSIDVDTPNAATYQIQSGSGQVTLTATQDVELSEVTSTSGTVSVTAGTGAGNVGAIIDALAAETVNITAGTIMLQANSGIGSDGTPALDDDSDIDISGTTLTATNTTSGDIQIRAAGSVALVQVSNPNGVVILDVTGQVTDSDTMGESANLVALSAAIRATTGIGTGVVGDNSDIDTNVGTLALETDSGAINIDEANALTLGTVGTLPGVVILDLANSNLAGAISVRSAGDLMVDNAVTNNAGGNITLISTGARLIVGANVQTVGGNGNIVGMAATDLLVNTGTISAVNGGTIGLTAGTADSDNGTAAGVLTMAADTLIQSGTGLVTLVGDGDVTIERIVTGGGSVNVTSLDGAVSTLANAGILVADLNISVGGTGTVGMTADTGVTIRDGVQTTDGAITINADADANTTGTLVVTSDAGASIVAGGAGDITVTAADIDLQAGSAVTAAADDVLLRTSTDTRTIGLGGGTGDFNLDNDEAQGITAAVLEIGRDEINNRSGRITVDLLRLDPTKVQTLVLRTGADVVESGSDTVADVIVQNLAIRSGTAGMMGGVALDVDVSTLAVNNSTNGDVRITDTGADAAVGIADGLTIADVTTANGGMIFGVNTPGAIRLQANAGNLTIQNTAAVNDLGAGATIDVTVTGDDAQLIVEAGANLQSTGGTHTYIADEMVIDPTATIVATGQTVNLRPFNAGELIRLGAAVDPGTAGELDLSDAELDTITATMLVIGGLDGTANEAGNITIAGAITADAHYATLKLETGGAVIDGTVTEQTDITVTNLVIDAVTGVGGAGDVSTEDLDIAVSTLDVDNAGLTDPATTRGNIFIAQTGDLSVLSLRNIRPDDATATTGQISVVAGGTITIATVGSGVQATDGTITLDANGLNSNVVLERAVQTNGTGAINVTADDSITFGPNGNLTALGSGDVMVQANTNGLLGGNVITMVAGTVINSGTGTLTLQSTGATGGTITYNQLVTDGAAVIVNSGAAVTGLATGSIQTTASGGGRASGTATITAATSATINGAIDTRGTTVGGNGLGGNVSVTANGGTITLAAQVDANGGGNAVDGGRVTLAANGSGADVLVQAAINTNNVSGVVTQGDVRITAADRVEFSAAGDVTATGAGAVLVQANADGSVVGDNDGGILRMADGTLIDAGTGTVTLEAYGDVTLGGVLTLNATANAVSITSAQGGVVDGGIMFTDIVANATGARVMIAAARGIGSTDALETQVDELDAVNLDTVLAAMTSGDIQIDETDAVSVVRLANTVPSDTNAATGQILLTTNRSGTLTDATITVLAAGSGVSATDGNIVLDARGAHSDIVLAAAVNNTATGGVTLAADDSVLVQANIVAAGSGNVLVQSNVNGAAGDTGNVLTMSAGTQIDSGTGSLTLRSTGTAGGAITYNQLVTEGGAVLVDSGNAVVGLATSSITTIGSLAVPNSGDVTIHARGTGNGVTLNGNIMAAGTTAGVDGRGGSLLVDTEAGSIIVAATVDMRGGNGLADGGNVTLDANGDNSDVLVQAAILTNDVVDATVRGNVTISADDSVVFTAAGDVTASGGGGVSVTANADGGVTVGDGGDVITMVDGTLIDGGSGTISLSARGNVTLGRLTTTGALSNIVQITTTNGAVLDAGDVVDPNIIDIEAANGGAVVVARNGFGASISDRIETTVASLSVNTSSGNGSQFITETDGLTDLALLAGTGSVTLTAGGSITDDSSDGLDIEATTATILLTAGDFGAMGNAIETHVDNLSVNTDRVGTVNDGSQFIAEQDGLLNLQLLAGAGNVTLTTTGSVIDQADAGATPDGTIDGVDIRANRAIIATNGGDFGQATNVIEIDVQTFEINTGGGAVFVNNLSVLISRIGPVLTNGGDFIFSAGGGVIVEDQIDARVNPLIDTGATGGEIRITAGGTITTTAPGLNTSQGVLSATGGSLRTENNNITVDVNGVGNDLLVQAGITTTGAGIVSLTADDVIAFGVAGDVRTGAGNITVTANTDGLAGDGVLATALNWAAGVAVAADGLTMVDNGSNTAEIISTTGEIRLSAGSNITLGRLVTGSASAAAVTVTSAAGAILDGGNTAGADTRVEDIDANNAGAVVTLSAFNGIGTGSVGAIETRVANLVASTVGNNGNQFFVETDGLTSLNLQAGAGNITLDVTTGDLNDGDTAVDVQANVATITLGAGQVGTGASFLNTQVDSLTVVTTNRDQFLREVNGLTALDLRAGSGAVTLDVTTGDVTDVDGATDIQAALATVTLGAGQFGTSVNSIQTQVNSLTVVTANRDQVIRELDGLTALDLRAGSGSVTLDVTNGDVTDTDGAIDIQAAAATVTLGSGQIGTAANFIQTQVNSLMVVTTNRDQFLREVDGLTALDLRAGAGSVTLEVTGDLTDSDGATDIQAAAATVTVTAGQVGTSASSIQTQVNDLTVVTTNRDQFLREVDGLAALRLDTGVGNVTLDVLAGSVTDGDSGPQRDIVATTARVTLDGGDFGQTGSFINTTVANLLVNTAGGSLFVEEADSLAAINLLAGTGNVTVTTLAGGIGDGPAFDGTGTGLDVQATTATFTVNGGDFGLGGNAIETAVRVLNVNTAAANTNQFIAEADGLDAITLNAGAGSIVMTLGTIFGGNVQANVLNARAAGSVTLGTTVNVLNVAATAAGAINITETDGVQLQTISTVNGSATINAGGTLSADFVSVSGSGQQAMLITRAGDIVAGTIAAPGAVTLNAAGAVASGAAAGNHVTTASLVANTGAGIGAAGNALRTATSTLAAQGGSGGVFVANSGALTINGVSAGGSDIVITTASPMTVAGGISNTGPGNISLTSFGSDGTMRVMAPVAANGDVRMTAGGDLMLMNTPAAVDVAGRSITGTAAGRAITGVGGDLPTLVSSSGLVRSVAPQISILNTPQITALGEADLTFSIGTLNETNMRLVIDWNDGVPAQRFQILEPMAAGTYTIRHVYGQTPNDNQAAPIVIRVMAINDTNINLSGINTAAQMTPDFFNAISGDATISDADRTALLASTSGATTLSLNSDSDAFTVPGDGFGNFFPPIRSDNTVLSVGGPGSVQFNADSGDAQQQTSDSGDGDARTTDSDINERAILVLRRIRPDGTYDPSEEIELPGDDVGQILQDLPEYLKDLPDGLYELLLIEAGEGRDTQTPRTINRFMIRGGKPSGSDYQPPAPTFDGSTPLPAPAGELQGAIPADDLWEQWVAPRGRAAVDWNVDAVEILRRETADTRDDTFGSSAATVTAGAAVGLLLSTRLPRVSRDTAGNVDQTMESFAAEPRPRLTRLRRWFAGR